MAGPWDRYGSHPADAFIPVTGPKVTQPTAGYSTTANPAPAQAYIPGSEADPAVVARKAAIEAGASAAAQAGKDIRVAGATAPIDVAKAVSTKRGEGEVAADPNLGERLNPQSRAKILEEYNSALQLGQLLQDSRKAFAAGPGQTTGLAGLYDYLPSAANGQFDDAGNRMRGPLKKALAFTGGENNTARESEVNLGGFVPGSYDRDARVLDKFTAVQQLVDSAKARAAQQLGGVPDANGHITPVPGGVALPDVELAKGPTKDVLNQQSSAIVTAMLRAGAGDEQINAALGAAKANPVAPEDLAKARDWLKRYPDATDAFSVMHPEAMTGWNRMANSPAMTAAGAFVNGATGGLLDEGVGAANSLLTGKSMDQAIAEANAGKQAAFKENWKSALLGNVAGGVATTMGVGGVAKALGIAQRLGKLAPAVGDLAYGAASGAGEENANRLLGAGIGAGSAVLGNRVAAGASGLIGKSLRGVRNEAVQYLHGVGVPLTVGQTMGGSVKGLEERVAGLPIAGDAVRDRYRDGLRSYNGVGFQQAGDRIGASITALGDDGLAQLDQAVGNSFDNALNHVTLNGHDPVFQNDMLAVRGHAASIPGKAGTDAQMSLQRRVDDLIDPASGEMSGRYFQQAHRGLARDASSYDGKFMGHDVGEVTRGAQDALDLMFERQAPGMLPQYKAANDAFRHQAVLTDALKAARGQISDGETLFYPHQLNTASVMGASKFGGKTAAMTGDRAFAQLAKAGQEVLPSRTPDSGTAGRLALLAIPSVLSGAGAGVGAGLGYRDGDAGEGALGGGKAGLALGALLAAGGTKGGQKALTKMLLDRPDLMVKLGDAVVDRVAPKSGIFGRSFGPNALYAGTR